MSHNAIETGAHQVSHRRQQASWALWLTVVLILIGAVLRLGNLDRQPLWLDEFATLKLATEQEGFASIWASVARRIHPPLHILLTKGMITFFPVTEFIMRWLSAASGILTLALLARYLLDLMKPIPAITGVLLLTFSPFHLHYCQEARSYALSTALLLFTAFLFRRGVISGKWRWWLMHSLCLIVLAYTHYFNLFLIGAEFLYLAILTVRRCSSRRVWRGFLSSILAVGIALIPLVPPFLSALGAQHILNRKTEAISLFSTLKTLAGGERRYAPTVGRLAGVGSIIAAISIGQVLCTRVLLFDTIVVGSPFLFIFVFLRAMGYTVPSFEERQFIVTLPFVITLISAGIAVMWDKRTIWNRGIALALVAGMLFAGFCGIHQYNTGYLKNRDFALVKYLDRVAKTGDLVLVNTYSAESTFAFYGDDRLIYWGKPRPDGESWVFSTQIGLSYSEDVHWNRTWEELISRSRFWLIYLPGQGPAALTDDLLEQRLVLERQLVEPFHVYLLGECDS